MRWSLIGLMLLCVVPTVPAGDAAKSNTLTPEEVKEGWLLLFDGETTFGWQISGDAKVERGTLVLGGENETRCVFKTPLLTGIVRFELEAEVSGKEHPTFCVLQLPSNILVAELAPFPQKGKSLATVSLKEDRSGAKIKFRVSLEDTKNKKPKTSEGEGPKQLGSFAFFVPPGVKLKLRDLKFQPDAAQPLFNNKDLTGWKVFPGRKSKFTVNDQGELNIKDGPGDLQTEKSFGDFLLQLECKSNGKVLNSGVFFRCIPGQYQNGYECQILNSFKKEPTQAYVIETYDPVSHKLVKKEKVNYTAVDYGTGAIYRRQPARKEMSKDGEWFTMTVVAHGNHFASWVNGIQVTDWTDNRPMNDNPRNGCRLQAGPISLQGHDPTTDLSFRNIRVVEYPASEAKK